MNLRRIFNTILKSFFFIISRFFFFFIFFFHHEVRKLIYQIFSSHTILGSESLENFGSCLLCIYDLLASSH